MRLAFAVLGAMMLTAATPAPAAPKSAGAAPRCFMIQQITGHTIGNERTLYLNVGGKSVYRVEMSNNCFGGAGPTDPITISPRGASSSVCGEQDLDVGATLNGGGLASRCIIDKMIKLTPPEAANLPKGTRP